MNTMALIVPSRGRPHNIERLNKALQDTEAEVDLYVGIDPDDDKLQQYKSLADHYSFNLVIANKREKFGPTLNRIALDIAPNYKYIAWMGDDHLPKTYKWDERYREVLDSVGVGVVYGNDLVMGEAIATELAMTSNIVQALGYAVPEGFVHLYIDNYFMDLARSIDRLVYLPDVIVQHMHPVAGHAQEDQTYIEANSPENWTNDRIRFEQYKANELKGDADKLWKLV